MLVCALVFGLGYLLYRGLFYERVELVYCTACWPEDPARCADSLTDALGLASEDDARKDARNGLCHGGDGGLLAAGCLARPLDQLRFSCARRRVSRPRVYLGPR